jgi:hypothetical protein
MRKGAGANYSFKFEGIISFLKKQQETGSEKIQAWIAGLYGYRHLSRMQRSKAEERIVAF